MVLFKKKKKTAVEKKASGKEQLPHTERNLPMAWQGKNKAEVRDLVVQMVLKLGMVLVTLRYTV